MSFVNVRFAVCHMSIILHLPLLWLVTAVPPSAPAVLDHAFVTSAATPTAVTSATQVLTSRGPMTMFVFICVLNCSGNRQLWWPGSAVVAGFVLLAP
jgi:hypothetical protein